MLRRFIVYILLIPAGIILSFLLASCSEDPAPNTPEPKTQKSALTITPAQAMIRVFTELTLSAFPDTSRYARYLLIWDFNDGMPPDTTSKKTVSHIFTSVGRYTIQVSLIDKIQSAPVATISIPVQVYEGQFRIAIVPDPVHATAGAEVQLSAVVLGGPLAGEKTFTWNFGNGIVISVPTMANTCNTATAYQHVGTFPVTVSLESEFLPGLVIAQDTAWVQIVYGPRPDSARKVTVSITGTFIYKRTSIFHTTTVSYDTTNFFSVYFSTYGRDIIYLNRKPFPWNENNRIDVTMEGMNTKQTGSWTLTTQLSPDSKRVESLFLESEYYYSSNSYYVDHQSLSVNKLSLISENFPFSGSYEYRGEGSADHVGMLYSYYHYSQFIGGGSPRSDTYVSLVDWVIPDTSRITVMFTNSR